LIVRDCFVITLLAFLFLAMPFFACKRSIISYLHQTMHAICPFEFQIIIYYFSHFIFLKHKHICFFYSKKVSCLNLMFDVGKFLCPKINKIHINQVNTVFYAV
jgi:hypothetical protein